MRSHPMTKYDAGQDLIACSDFLGDKYIELKSGGFLKEAEVVQKARLMIGDAFEELGSHDFGLPSNCLVRKR